MIRTSTLQIKTTGEGDIVNVSEQIQDVLTRTDAKEGIVMLFLQSTTASITIMEYEEGLLTDLPRSIDKLVPKSGEYEHEKAYHDGNGHSHIRSSIIGVSLTVPFSTRKLLLGTWQQIVICEFDVRPRLRNLVVQVFSD